MISFRNNFTDFDFLPDIAQSAFVKSAQDCPGLTTSDSKPALEPENHVPMGKVYPNLPVEPISGQLEQLPETALQPLYQLRPGVNRLDGFHVNIESAGWVRLPIGQLVIIPPAQPGGEGHFEYNPSHGGISPRRNERSEGRHWQTLVEATCFGQVNAYYHANQLAMYSNLLLAELGVKPLPKVRVLVGAHSGYDPITTAFEQNRILAGGHYRVRAQNYAPAENLEVSESGEIHLGPGRYYLKWGQLSSKQVGFVSHRHREAGRTRHIGGQPYLHQPSHNPAIIYHEYAHHLVRHTADFRCNAQRIPYQQSNVKSWLDEGTCDYFTAVMLGHSQIYRWHRPGLPSIHYHYRNLEPVRPLSCLDNSPRADPHYNGTIWASLLWHLRQRLINEESLTGKEVDKIVIQTLISIGQSGLPNASMCPVIRRENIRLRNSFSTVSYFLKEALAEHGLEKIWSVLPSALIL